MLDENRTCVPQRMTIQDRPQRPEVPDLKRQRGVQHREDAVDVGPAKGLCHTRRDDEGDLAG